MLIMAIHESSSKDNKTCFLLRHLWLSPQGTNLQLSPSNPLLVSLLSQAEGSSTKYLQLTPKKHHLSANESLLSARISFLSLMLLHNDLNAKKTLPPTCHPPIVPQKAMLIL